MRILRWLGRIIMVFICIFACVYAYDWYGSMQGTNRTSSAQTSREEQIESREDVLTRTERIERLFHIKEAVSEAMVRRVPLKEQTNSNSIADNAKRALVAIEDKRFYEHGAIDPMGVARAMYTNVVAGETVEGGSTITQQLVKNLFLSSKRIMSRKVEEAILAMLVEKNYTKDEIITMYLNTIYYGHNYYGITAAAKGYFNTTPGRLTLAQASMLAGLPQAPSYYDPLQNYDGAKARQKQVLQRMVEQGMITRHEAVEAYNQDVGLVKE